MNRLKLIRTLALGVVLLVPATSEAGAPLICQTFQTGASSVLPWGDGSDWNTLHGRYDIQRLTADTMRLLSSHAPVIARMENLRRATLYAAKDARVASELLAALLARAEAPGAGAHALFDAGYLIESYKQSSTMNRGVAPSRNGYALVTRALALVGTDAEMEFAASLMTSGATSAEHRRRAVSGATNGSLLARNITR